MHFLKILIDFFFEFVCGVSDLYKSPSIFCIRVWFQCRWTGRFHMITYSIKVINEKLISILVFSYLFSLLLLSLSLSLSLSLKTITWAGMDGQKRNAISWTYLKYFNLIELLYINKCLETFLTLIEEKF